MHLTNDNDFVVGLAGGGGVGNRLFGIPAKLLGGLTGLPFPKTLRL